MIGWVLLVSLALLLFRREIAVSLGALPGPTPRALPPVHPADPALSGGIVRLLDRIDDVFAIEGELTPPIMQVCAKLGAIAAPTFRAVASRPAGPATRAFTELHRAIEELDDEERTTLSDAGLDPADIRRLLVASGNPERWRRELLDQLERHRREIRRLRPRRYG